VIESEILIYIGDLFIIYFSLFTMLFLFPLLLVGCPVRGSEEGFWLLCCLAASPEKGAVPFYAFSTFSLRV
jgi:hypothetical protein